MRALRSTATSIVPKPSGTLIRVGVVLLVLFAGLVALPGGAAAQEGNDTNGTAVDGSQDFCNTNIASLISNGLLFLTAGGPMVGLLAAGWNMFKASATNNSSKQKEFQGQIKTSLLYGMGLGMLMAIGKLVFSWAPGVAMCPV